MTTRTPVRTARLALTALAFAAALCGTAGAQGTGKLKVGLMLPYSGTYTALGVAIENGFKLYVDEHGGKLAGREIEYFKVDDESDPAKATDNVNKLIKRDNVDVIVGTVHSGVAMAMAKAAKESGTVLIVPNAGADAVTGPMCAPNIFRSSFSNWQPAYAMGEVAAKQQGKKKVMTITWKYAAGEESVNGFKEGFEKNGGKVDKQLTLPFPNVEFQALLTEIAAAKPDAVYAFFAGGGAVKFVKDYQAAGPEQDHSAVRPRLPDRRHARRAGRIGAGHADHAALRRRPQHAARQRVPRGLRQVVQAAARRVRGAGLRRRADAGRGPERDQGRHLEEGRVHRRHREGQDRQPARHVHREQVAQPGAGHLPAQGGRQGKQAGEHGHQGPGGPGARLQDVSRAAQAFGYFSLVPSRPLIQLTGREPPCGNHTLNWDLTRWISEPF